ncbi:MAG: type II CAAX prenyl endopeptidase Rce1 family protein [Candidatus Bipolaricaulia bacterium]
MKDIFFNERRLRAGWRLLLFVALLFLLFTILTAPLARFFLPPKGAETPQAMRTSLLLDGYLLLPLLLASWLMTRYIDRRPFASLGLDLKGPWGREFLIGALIGLAMGGAYLVAGLLAGSVRLGWGRPSWGLAALIGSLLLAAFFEETLFHGYPFQTLIEGLGPYPALFLISVVFSLFHRANPHFSLLGSINIGLAGLLLGVGLLRTRALWLPIGIHFSWNLFQALFSFPISGLELGGGPFQAEPGGPELLSGGPFGPEGSIIATIVFSLAIVVIVLYKGIRPSERMEELWQEHLRPLGGSEL